MPKIVERGVCGVRVVCLIEFANDKTMPILVE